MFSTLRRWAQTRERGASYNPDCDPDFEEPMPETSAEYEPVPLLDAEINRLTRELDNALRIIETQAKLKNLRHAEIAEAALKAKPGDGMVAAAPDMLEALRVVVGEEKHSASFEEIMRICRAAISKAELLAALDEKAAALDLSTPPAPAPDAGEAVAYAERLAVALHEKHYAAHTPEWKPLRGDLIGLLTQVDNMTAGLTRLTPQPPAVESEADGIERFNGPLIYSPATDVQMLPDEEGEYVRHSDHQAALKKIERLRRERDEWKNSAFLSDCEAHSGQLEEMTARAEAAEAAEASNKALREGLEPFAREADQWEGYSDDENLVEGWTTGPSSSLNVGDLRRARALLSEKDGGADV